MSGLDPVLKSIPELYQHVLINDTLPLASDLLTWGARSITFYLPWFHVPAIVAAVQLQMDPA
jgi:hypothetical protein